MSGEMGAMLKRVCQGEHQSVRQNMRVSLRTGP